MCWLLAAEDTGGERGQDPPRPLTIEPPFVQLVKAGETFTFGVSLIGKAQDFLPFIVRALQKVGQTGVGKGRGQFKLMSLNEYSPLWDTERVLMEGNRIKIPTLQVTQERIQDAAVQLRHDEIVLEFKTPLTLTHEGQTLQRVEAVALVGRAVERCQRMVQIAHTDGQDDWKGAYTEAVAHAGKLRRAYDDTQWLAAQSGSRRSGSYSTLGGLVGRVRFEGELAPVLDWLLWGQSLHVGKNAVKGNGWYQVICYVGPRG